MVSARLLPFEVIVDKLLVVFTAVFLAELGDKTQLATLLFAADGQRRPLAVFVAAAAALLASTAIAVALGAAGHRYLTVAPLKLLVCIGFIAIGVWTVWSHFAHT